MKIGKKSSKRMPEVGKSGYWLSACRSLVVRPVSWAAEGVGLGSEGVVAEVVVPLGAFEGGEVELESGFAGREFGGFMMRGGTSGEARGG